jgi:hypothetical protein
MGYELRHFLKSVAIHNPLLITHHPLPIARIKTHKDEQPCGFTFASNLDQANPKTDGVCLGNYVI